jgi:hypothetical protein
VVLAVGRAWRRALYTRSSPFYVGDGRTVADNHLEGEAWCGFDDELLSVAPSALLLHKLYSFLRGSRTSVVPSALHTLFSSVTDGGWRAHNMSESGTDSYMYVAPAPQGGRVW